MKCRSAKYWLRRNGWLTVAILGATAGVAFACGSERETVQVRDSGSVAGSTVAAEPEESFVAEAEPPPEQVAQSAPEGNPETLAEWGQLEVAGAELRLADGVRPYSLNSSLFSDYAHKLRTISVPPGSGPAIYDGEEVFDFPVGTIITKTFYYPRDAGGRVIRTAVVSDVTTPLILDEVRLVETRVLTRRADGWVAFPYVWNDEQTEATLHRAGDLMTLTLVDGGDVSAAGTDFPYVVPNVNQCAGCHATNNTTRVLLPIGPKARHLNKAVDLGGGSQAQLALWQDWGLLGETPPVGELPQSAVWDDDALSLDSRARAYLDVNCAHCHNRVGPADVSGLFLEPSTELGVRLGVCKPPIAAGTGTGDRLVGIDPGNPDESIFIYRMETEDPGAMMPELGRAVIHDEGVELISRWIESLAGNC